ncbi:MAG: RraA family protein [Planctomycetota bacterium]|nr:RraA family protein [Planctomycetota bacterium]MDA1212870.1 RraA family protein [Planctomycetota bacterium]
MTTIPQLSADALQALAKYDTPTICNAIELFDVLPRNSGYMNGSIKACFPKMPPMIGYALTTTFRSMSPPRGGDVYAGIDQQLSKFTEIPGPPVIVFQDLDEPVAAATFGEVMCSTYKTFGAKGIVTSGAGRDLDQVEALGFPAFTGGSICSHGYCHMISVNVPVTVGGICIYPGDLLHGDLNGLTTIPHTIASEVADVCHEVMVAEQIVLDYLKDPNPNVKGFAEARKACGAQFGEISKRLKGRSR